MASTRLGRLLLQGHIGHAGILVELVSSGGVLQVVHGPAVGRLNGQVAGVPHRLNQIVV